MSFYGGVFFGGSFLSGGGVGPFFGGPFFGGGFFGELEEQETPKTGGKGDNKRRKTIYKPTGLTYRKPVEQRLVETHEIAKEVVRDTYKEVIPVARMSLAEIDAEIGLRLRRQVQEEEEILLLLMAASVAG